MKVYTTITLCLMLCALTGCNQNPAREIDRLGDIELVSVVNNIAVENAIVTQHTLYPYHFEPNGAKLNELGLSDLEVLIRHYNDHPGTLNIRRGEATGEVYQARVQYVLDKLRGGGIARERVAIQDGLPGGPGMATEQVVKVLEKSASTALKEQGGIMGQ